MFLKEKYKNVYIWVFLEGTRHHRNISVRISPEDILNINPLARIEEESAHCEPDQSTTAVIPLSVPVPTSATQNPDTGFTTAIDMESSSEASTSSDYSTVTLDSSGSTASYNPHVHPEGGRTESTTTLERGATSHSTGELVLIILMKV